MDVAAPGIGSRRARSSPWPLRRNSSPECVRIGGPSSRLDVQADSETLEFVDESADVRLCVVTSLEPVQA
jgi:hypothetical protein